MLLQLYRIVVVARSKALNNPVGHTRFQFHRHSYSSLRVISIHVDSFNIPEEYYNK